MSYNMTGDEYNMLYRGYLKRSPKDLLDLAGFKKGHSVLDLCSGSNGRASKMALEMGASYVCAVDENPNVSGLRLDGIDAFHGSIDSFFDHMGYYRPYGRDTSSKIYPDLKFDTVICQQGINYWFKDNGLPHEIRKAMKVGGKFVFNTFNNKPPEKIVFKRYEIEGFQYGEMQLRKGNTIFHTQAFEGLLPHLSHISGYHNTEFQWISKREYCDVLGRDFDLDINRFDNTDIYVCTNPS
jgi:SAM-dependent methyltransferase